MALKRIQQGLDQQKLSLKMLDGYRPARAVADMVAWSRNGKETPAERRYNPGFSKAELGRNSGSSTNDEIMPSHPIDSRYSRKAESCFYQALG